MIATFSARAAHPIPDTLKPPPESWTVEFPAMAEEAGLSTIDCLEAFSILRQFWESGSFA